MSKKKTIKIKWFNEPEEHDYTAAKSYLDLIIEEKIVDGLIKDLINAPMVSFKAKDIFRASGLSALGISNQHVEANIKKIEKKKFLSPVLLIRDVRTKKVIVADGYHRICAVYLYNEDIMIPCKIVSYYS